MISSPKFWLFIAAAVANLILIWPVAMRFRHDLWLGVIVILAMLNQAASLALRSVEP